MHPISRHVVMLAAAICLATGSAAQDAPVLGERPRYTDAALADVPNARWIRERIWAPGLDAGYVPQGLARAEGALLVAGYRSTSRGEDRGPCRVFRVDPATGAQTGQFDLPDECGHAGGLAYDGAGVLYVVDTQVVLAVDLAQAFKSGHARSALRQTLRLDGRVRGSFSTWHQEALWLGSWHADKPGDLFRFPAALLAKQGGSGTLKEADAAQRLEVPAKAQGAAFDGAGRLWVALSNTKRGQLAMLDGTGKVLATYEVAPGVEGLAFDGPTKLWTVSEVGSQRWLRGIAFYPLVFALDVQAMKSGW